MKRLFLIFFPFIPVLVLAQEYLPVSSGEIIKHTYYTLSYNEAHEQANWVSYHLTSAMEKGKEKRTDNFRTDPSVSTGSATLNDYKGSGYDRGHLCPAADMKLNHTAMSETFFLSNMSPQAPEFNRGIWKELEETVRDWAMQDGDIYVVSGPVFKDNKGAIGPDRVTVPGYYYKVIYDPHGQGKMIALLLPNGKGTKPLSRYEVTVDSIEALTGIDFFPELPDNREAMLESSADFSAWQFPSLLAGKPATPGKQSPPVSASKTIPANAAGYYHGHKLYNGPRGGCYYINKNGNKTYVARGYCNCL